MNSSLKNKSEKSFDLDAYIEEQSRKPEISDSSKIQEPDSQNSYFFKNAALVSALVLTSFLWYHDWSPVQAWNSVFGSNEATTQVSTPTAPGFNIQIPYIPDIPAPPIPGASQSEGLLDYLAWANDAGFADEFSTVGLQAMYNANVPIEYLQQLKETGLIDKFSYPGVIALYSSDVPINYLTTLAEMDLLDEFSYPGVIALQNSGVDISYIQYLAGSGLLDAFSYPGVIALSSNGVDINYLTLLNEAGLLGDFSYPGVIALYQNNVPIDFINSLKERNLLENLSYPDIIRLYQADN